MKGITIKALLLAAPLLMAMTAVKANDQYGTTVISRTAAPADSEQEKQCKRVRALYERIVAAAGKRMVQTEALLDTLDRGMTLQRVITIAWAASCNLADYIAIEEQRQKQ